MSCGYFWLNNCLELPIQKVQGEACRGSALAHCQHRLLYFGMEGQNLPEDLSSFGFGLSYSIEKTPHPMEQVISDWNLRQVIIIAGAVAFKEIRKVGIILRRGMRITMFGSQIRLLRPLSPATS